MKFFVFVGLAILALGILGACVWLACWLSGLPIWMASALAIAVGLGVVVRLNLPMRDWRI